MRPAGCGFAMPSIDNQVIITAGVENFASARGCDVC